jgi:excisionase family DNA binding protein
MSSDEAADYLHVSKSFLFKLTSRSELAHWKSKGGGKLTFARPDLDAWLKAHRVASLDEIANERR